MQKHKEPSGYFKKSTEALHGEQEGLKAPISSNSLIYYFANNFSYGQWWYRPFHTGSVPGSSGIK